MTLTLAEKPSNLVMSAADPFHPVNYRVYEVAKALNVAAGPILPWFGQRGYGTQFKANGSIITLVTQGYLKPVLDFD